MNRAMPKRARPAPRGVITDDPRLSLPLAKRVRILPDLDAEAVVARAEAAIAALKDDYRASLGTTFGELAALYRAASARPGRQRDRAARALRLRLRHERVRAVPSALR